MVIEMLDGHCHGPSQLVPWAVTGEDRCGRFVRQASVVENGQLRFQRFCNGHSRRLCAKYVEQSRSRQKTATASSYLKR